MENYKSVPEICGKVAESFVTISNWMVLHVKQYQFLACQCMQRQIRKDGLCYTPGTSSEYTLAFPSMSVISKINLMLTFCTKANFSQTIKDT